MDTQRQVWVSGLAERIGCFGLGEWLENFGRWLPTSQPYPPVAPAEFATISGRGLEVKLHDPEWHNTQSTVSDRWVLYEATIADTSFLPFGLAALGETPSSAERRLSRNSSWDAAGQDGSRSVSYFLEDLRVVIVRFRPGLLGVESVKLARLFAWPDWRNRTLSRFGN